jgi:transposase
MKAKWVAFDEGAEAPEGTAMQGLKDIILVVDYHSKNIEVRWLNCDSGEEKCLNRPTSKATILRVVEEAVKEAGVSGGKVVWIMESTTGWARVKGLIADRTQFILLNTLQMPKEPKAHKRKSDKLDTGRALREYLNGKLPRSHQPSAWWRQLRRVVNARQDVVYRQTAVKNRISSLLHQETWEDRTNLWTVTALARLGQLQLPESDRIVMDGWLEELKHLADRQRNLERRLQAYYDQWPQAQWLDEVRGIGMVTAVSLLAHIGPIERFATAEELISYAGIAPGHRSSDQTKRNGKIGGGGTDGHLRWLLIEATTWTRQIPRYKKAHERAVKRHGKNIAKIILARMLLRSLHKMLTDNIRFNQTPSLKAQTTATAAIAQN